MHVDEHHSLTLLGRPALDVDDTAPSVLAARGRILITGAGGSLGSVLAARLAAAGADLVLVDRDESALHALELTLQASGAEGDERFVLADITRAGLLARLLRSRRPDVVIHAAALKHVPMLERFADEAWAVNVEGTRAVLAAAAAAGVERLVNLSTDKACQPVSVLGRSKRIGERLVAAHGPGWVSVRLANVVGTRGSVTQTFAAQLDAGVALSLTHPQVSRYFLTPGEAACLLAEAAVRADAGGVLVPRLVTPCRIRDLAEAFMRLRGQKVALRYSGLRAGEKLHEDLIAPDERPVALSPTLWRVDVAALTSEDLPEQRHWVCGAPR